jgi:hypothetical protein
MLTDTFHARVAADLLAHRKLAGEWDGQDMRKNIANAARKRNPIRTPRDRIQLSAWSALGELVLAAENDARILVGRQEKRKFSLMRLTVLRRGRKPFKRNLRYSYNLIGRVVVRPRGLRI